jgi:hypothetical protein
MIPEAPDKSDLKAAFVECSVPRAGEVYRVNLSHGVVERWKVVRVSRSHLPEHIVYERWGVLSLSQNFERLGLDKLTFDCWHLMSSVYQIIYFGYDP